MKKTAIMEDLKKQILDEEYSRGQYLIERDLCEQYGVSRTPMREILFSLVNEGLVVQERGKGFSVRELDLKQLFEIFEAREGIEGMAAKLCARRLTSEGQKRFTELKRQLETVHSQMDAAEGIVLGRKLHHLIVDIAGNELISDFSLKLDNMATLVGNITREVVQIERESCKHHLHIIEAILAGNPEESENRMRAHIVITFRRLISALHPDYALDAEL
jgi:DNA-binding GntR family transcriptional regulator